MRPLLRSCALSVAALGAAACAQIVGVGDVPLPPDASVVDAALDGGAEAAGPDGPSTQGPDGTLVAEAGSDVTVPTADATPDVAHEAAPEAEAPDTSTCPPWDRYDLTHCGPCGQAQCCADLAACEAPDDAGLDDAGHSRCELYLTCVASYANSAQAGAAAESTCQGGNAYPPSAVSLASAALACIRASCPADCDL